MKLHKEKQSWYLHFEEQAPTDHWSHGPMDKGKQVVGNPKTFTNMKMRQNSWPTVKQGLENT